jgi:hypothetical protein
VSLLPLDEPSFWIDNSLSPLVAQALKLVGYNIIVQKDISEFSDLDRVLDDKHIIPWLAANQAIWIHADNNSKREHRKQIAAGAVRTVWIHRAGGKMSNRAQLRILAYSLPDLIVDFGDTKNKQQHYQLSVHGQEPHTKITRKPMTLAD